MSERQRFPEKPLSISARVLFILGFFLTLLCLYTSFTFIRKDIQISHFLYDERGMEPEQFAKGAAALLDAYPPIDNQTLLFRVYKTAKDQIVSGQQLASWRSAIALLEPHNPINKNDITIPLNLGAAYGLLFGTDKNYLDYEKAVAYYNEGLQKRPKGDYAIWNSLYCLYRLGRDEGRAATAKQEIEKIWGPLPADGQCQLLSNFSKEQNDQNFH